MDVLVGSFASSNAKDLSQVNHPGLCFCRNGHVAQKSELAGGSATAERTRGPAPGWGG